MNSAYNKKGDEEFTSQQDILFPKVFDVDDMRVLIYWKLPHPVEKLYPYADYKIWKISKDMLVIGDYTDFAFVNGRGNVPNRGLSKQKNDKRGVALQTGSYRNNYLTINVLLKR